MGNRGGEGIIYDESLREASERSRRFNKIEEFFFFEQKVRLLEISLSFNAPLLQISKYSLEKFSSIGEEKDFQWYTENIQRYLSISSNPKFSKLIRRVKGSEFHFCCSCVSISIYLPIKLNTTGRGSDRDTRHYYFLFRNYRSKLSFIVLKYIFDFLSRFSSTRPYQFR